MADYTNIQDQAPLEGSIDLTELLAVIKRRRLLVVGVWCFTVIACIVYCFTATPIFQADSVIIIDKDDVPDSGGGMGGAMMLSMALLGSNNDYAQTQCDILQSRSVMTEVIRRLKLENNEDFFSKKGLIAWIKSLDTADKETILNEMLKVFDNNLKVEKVLRSQCIKVSYRSKNPELAAAIANSVVEAYRGHTFEMKIDSIREAADWLKSNMDQEREKLEVAEQALLAYQEKNDIIMDFSRDSENTNMAVKKMGELSILLVQAGSERAEAETRYRQAASVAGRSDKLDSVPEIQQSELITRVKTMEAELQQRLARLEEKYGHLHPQMVAMQSQLKTMRAKKEQEIKRIISALENAYLAKLAKEKTIKDELAAHKADFFKLGKNAKEYTRLYADAAAARAMYGALLKRFKETEVTEDLKVGNVRVVDKAVPPVEPVKPKKNIYTLTAVFFGLLAGLSAAFVFEKARGIARASKQRDQARDYN